MEDNQLTLKSILFICNINSIRSPMAEAILKLWFDKKFFIDSFGVWKGIIVQMGVDVFKDKGFDLSNHKTKIFSNLEDNYFDLIIAFTEEAYDEAVTLTKTEACEIELLNIPDASQTTGNRQQRLDSYRSVRDLLIEKLQNRFKGIL